MRVLWYAALHPQADRDLAAANEARRAQGLSPVFAYRSVYSPALGMFRQMDMQQLCLGTYLQVRHCRTHMFVSVGSTHVLVLRRDANRLTYHRAGYLSHTLPGSEHGLTVAPNPVSRHLLACIGAIMWLAPCSGQTLSRAGAPAAGRACRAARGSWLHPQRRHLPGEPCIQCVNEPQRCCRSLAVAVYSLRSGRTDPKPANVDSQVLLYRGPHCITLWLQVGDFLFVDGGALDPPKGSTQVAADSPSSSEPDDEASDGEVRPVTPVLRHSSTRIHSAVTSFQLYPFCVPSSCTSPDPERMSFARAPCHFLPATLLQAAPTSPGRTFSPLGSACRAWGVVQLVAVEAEGEEGEGDKAKGNGRGRAPPFRLRVRHPAARLLRAAQRTTRPHVAAVLGAVPRPSANCLSQGSCRLCISQSILLSTRLSKSLQVHRYYRPEDIAADLAYPAGWWDLYAPALAPAVGADTAGQSAAAQEQTETGPKAEAVVEGSGAEATSATSSAGAGGSGGADPWVYVLAPGCVRGPARVERLSKRGRKAREAAAAAPGTNGSSVTCRLPGCSFPSCVQLH